MNDMKEALSELTIRLQFYATEIANVFYGVTTQWAVPRAPDAIPHTKEASGTDWGTIGIEDCPALGYTDMSAVLFHRREWHHNGRKMRDQAYCLAIYQYLPYSYFTIIERDLGAIFGHLAQFGYSNKEMWAPFPRELVAHHVAHVHTGQLWNSQTFGIPLYRQGL
jgi:hypothetical protein